jgi:hypothetical protein
MKITVNQRYPLVSMQKTFDEKNKINQLMSTKPALQKCYIQKKKKDSHKSKSLRKKKIQKRNR